MKRAPWEINRDMFLSFDEIRHLRMFLSNKICEGSKSHFLSNHLDQLIIEMLLFSGLRTSEFCNLTLGDIRFDEEATILFVRRSRGENRIVYLPNYLRLIAAHYIKMIRPRFLPLNVAAKDLNQCFVFNERKRPYERTGLYRRVVRILEEAGLGSRASVQLLRHTYGYIAYAQTGGNLLFVQRQLGHAHPMVTSIYAQFVNESYNTLADKVYLPIPNDQNSDLQTRTDS